ncbi:MAG: sodium:proton antiporter [Clostridiales bacterium]|nr:sodium:proton antiporter [Clostridiales bacterium]MCF8022816.1 sodium:proton antiporter [Clostridiales bacterium]
MFMEANWQSILPLVVVIPVAVWTKQVLPGLILGLLLGSYLVEPTLLGGFEQMAAYIIENLTQEGQLMIIAFLYIFVGIINMIKMTGGIKGFVDLSSNRIKTKKSALSLIWLSVLGTFSAPTFRIVTISPVMKALAGPLEMSRARLGFIIETTSGPIIALIPVATAYIGYMISLINVSLQNQGIEGDSYTLFLKSIPLNFFSLAVLLMGAYFSFFHRHKKEKKLLKTEDNPENEEEEKERISHSAISEKLPSKPENLIIPLGLILGLTIFLTWWDGYNKVETGNLLQAFIAANVTKAMFVSIVITSIFTVLMYLLQGFSLKRIINQFFAGGNELMPVIFLLTLVWALSSTTEDLGLSGFVTQNLGWVPGNLVPPVIFLLGAVISYFIGSSWGTWGILMPLGISMSAVSDSSLPLIIGAVFASGVFGAFTSPLSDNTITTARIFDLPVIEYSNFKLKFGLIPLASAFAAYFAAALAW